MRTEPLDTPERIALASGPLPTARPPTDSPSPAFEQVLKDSLQSVDRLQHEADQAIQRLAVNGDVNLHTTMIAVEKADLSFRLMMQIRNKIVEAYQEVMRMQV